MKRSILLLALAICGASSLLAQRTPSHPMDIHDADWSTFYNFFDAWTPGTPPTGVSAMDDQFFISRQRPLPRITGADDYQVRPEVPAARKFCLWTPLDDPTATWKALPRYCFEGDNYSMWSYTDIHGNWTAPWFRCTAGISDAAAKNGTKVGTLLSIPYGQYVSVNSANTQYNATFNKLLKRSGSNFVNAEKLVKLLKYYGINGVGVNSEFSTSAANMNIIQGFFAQCHKEAAKIGWDFQVYWYDGTSDSGGINFDQGLGNHNKNMFGTGDNIVTDMMFANYNWGSGTITGTVAKAQELNRSPYDYYMGMNIQGRGLRRNEHPSSSDGAYWDYLKNGQVSIGFWGAHSQGLIHQSATDDGTADIAIQRAYLKKQELIFSGANRNPAVLPATAKGSSLGNAELQGGFQGMATYLTAKSTIQQIPFVTRFNLGNGLKFRNKGEVTFDHKWYNLNTQDFLPTWRFWITDRADQGQTDGINAQFTFDDAYFGGSCLELSGQTAFSRVKLFKTLLDVNSGYDLSVTYKTVSGTATHAKVFVALQGALTTYKEIALPAGEAGKWTTFTAKLQDLGIADGSKVAMIGLTTENTAADYKMYVGELAIRNAAQEFGTVKPTILNTEIIRGRYNALDFKIHYRSKNETGLEMKTYNDEVGTWYFEIWMQQEGQPEQLLTATTSWAAYVNDAPLVSGMDHRKVRFGVRAVAPDGSTPQPTRWTQYKDVPYDDPQYDVVCDKPVIKPAETFTLSFKDDMIAAAQKWEILDPVSGSVLKTGAAGVAFTTSLPNVGSYDLRVTQSDGAQTMVRGKVIISPEATGAVPTIESISASKTAAATGEDVTYTYVGRKGEGRVSHALKIEDPNMLQIDGHLQLGKTYTYALWVKADKFSHDKQGTNLISKNSVADAWPHNNWGDLWVQIREGNKCCTDTYNGGDNGQVHAANEVSFNTMGWLTHDLAWEQMISKGYSITPGEWVHVAVTQDDSNRQQLFFNGKRVATATFPQSTRREQNADSRIHSDVMAHIYIGGGGVYKSGLCGVIDEVQVWNKALTEAEVQQAMQGFATAPEGLQAYYTFETINAEGKFDNQGRGGDYAATLVVMEDSGGESTASARYVQKTPENDALGHPGITGTLDITAKATWTLDGASSETVEGDAATVSYNAAGTYGAALRLENGWAAAQKSEQELVEVTGGTGIDAAQAAQAGFAVYPNPFAEQVTFRFAEAGAYTVNIIAANGAVLQRTAVNAAAGSAATVRVNAPAGKYVVQVVKDGRQYKAVHVIKK